MEYSKYQKAVFDWVENGKGNCIVNAVAGSGKSTTALQSTSFMVGDIIFFAFNKKIQAHLERKLSSMGLPNARAATFHSEGLKNLTRSKGKIKLDNSKIYYITEKYCQSAEYKHIEGLNAARPFIQKLVGFAKEYAFGVKGQRSIDDTEAWMEIIQTQDITLDAECDFYDVIEIAKDVLRESNRDFRNIDFADMVYLPLVYDIQCLQYDWVIVDEAQDTNVSRKLFIAKVLKPSGRLLMIGDTNQSIYAFCGAENNSMEILKDMFNCVELPLSICYRCGKNIIEEAKKLQPHIEAFDGNPDGEIQELKYDDFLAKVETMNLSAKDGIICRNNAPNVALAFALIRKGIGCRIEGRDIGQNLITLCNKWKRVSDLNEFTLKLSAYFEKEFEKASRVKMQILEDKLQTMIILIERCQSLGKNDVNSLKSLIESMFTDNGDPKNADLVTLSSIHKAKGLEFHRCFTLGNSQLIPSRYAVTADQKIQEENLKYIAITRAERILINITDIPTRASRQTEE